MTPLLLLPLQKSFNISFPRVLVAALLNKQIGDRVEGPLVPDSLLLSYNLGFCHLPNGIVVLRKEVSPGNLILLLEQKEDASLIVLWLSSYGNSGILKPNFGKKHKEAPGEIDPDYAAVMEDYKRMQEIVFHEENFEALGGLL